MADEKSRARQADDISTVMTDYVEHVKTQDSLDANEQIVQHLQTTGEEVGMTWRTIMAAVVSLCRAELIAICAWGRLN